MSQKTRSAREKFLGLALILSELAKQLEALWDGTNNNLEYCPERVAGIHAPYALAVQKHYKIQQNEFSLIRVEIQPYTFSNSAGTTSLLLIQKLDGTPLDPHKEEITYITSGVEIAAVVCL
ncbi:hypothetical protein K469DRAFT_788900 [Zopfia rhizophila CBS 207.26]|uniref:Uncharacterized protein n=1 Tax=Zopfia rhizophila CBS 207.26 TaxID=1314779 RepID=A0A6A6EMJ6_9PEZI|nr:hypothetical protein K469DRAFT_788900 [Zopfia rhizophila CBS 207.26]